MRPRARGKEPRERLLFRTEEYEEARLGAYTADVEAAALRFDRIVQIFSAHDFRRAQLQPQGLPVWLDEEGVPVPIDPTDAFLDSLSGGGGIRYPIQDNINFGGMYRDSSEQEGFGRDRIRSLSVGDAVEGFRRGLVEFLTVRLDESLNEGPGTTGSVPLVQGPSSARVATPVRRAVTRTSRSRVKQEKPVFRSLGAAAATASGLASPPYLPFTVHTRTSGLDIEQAPAYFLSWTFFGGPTTPRDGFILPGLYRFRGQDAQGNYRYDPKKFRVPPLQYASTIL